MWTASGKKATETNKSTYLLTSSDFSKLRLDVRVIFQICIDREAARLSVASDPDRAASFDLGDLPDDRPDGTIDTLLQAAISTT